MVGKNRTKDFLRNYTEIYQSGEGSQGIPRKLLKALKNLYLCSEIVPLPIMSAFYLVVTLYQLDKTMDFRQR